MRQALQRLFRWIVGSRVTKAPPRSRATVCLRVESLEERVALASLLDALPAPGPSFAAAHATTAMTLTSATFDMAVQGVSLVYAQNAGPSVTVSFAAGTVANEIGRAHV